jgi:hypothetical protein
MRLSFGILTAAALLAQSYVGFAAPMFAPEEFSKVTTAAVAQFKADMPTMFDSFYGVTLTRNIVNGVEIGVLVKVYTKDHNAAPVVMSKYNCHKHSANELECHPAA